MPEESKESKETCPDCNGTGLTDFTHCGPEGIKTVLQPCRRCWGVGNVACGTGDVLSDVTKTVSDLAAKAGMTAGGHGGEVRIAVIDRHKVAKLASFLSSALIESLIEANPTNAESAEVVKLVISMLKRQVEIVREYLELPGVDPNA